MARKIDWLNHSLEFLVVVIGILLAFQLENCSNSRQQQATLENHFQEIRQETEENLYQLELAQDYCRSHMETIDSLLYLVQAGGPVTAINSLCFKILDIRGAYLKQNAYSSLVESGDIRFIEDFEIKKAIIDLYEYYDYVKVFDVITLNAYSSYYYPYVMENLDINSARPQELSVYTTKPFINAISAYRYTLNLTFEKYQACQEFVTSFQTIFGE